MANTDAPFVTCRLFGQLGNQLFQIATTLSYAWDHGCISVFPLLDSPEDGISYNRDRIFFRLDPSLPNRPFLSEYREKKTYTYSQIPFQRDLILSGYFQAWRYFHHHRGPLLSMFEPSPAIVQKLQGKYGDLIAKPNTVAVHVRTWVKSNHEKKLHPFLGFQYYRNALDSFPSSSEFVVFSDRINWCKKNFPQFNKNFTFIEGNDGVEDFFLMTQMKDIIMSNSTYSWWGAYANRNPEKIIVAPQSFVDPRPDPRFQIKDTYLFQNEQVYLPDWKLIAVDFNESYPEDMYCYDACSQSLNG